VDDFCVLFVALGVVFPPRLALVFPIEPCLFKGLEGFFPFWQIAKILDLKRRLGQPRTR
jgi:hypothetical protein